MMMSVIAMGVVTVTWVVVGFSIAFGESDYRAWVGSFEYALFRNLDMCLWGDTGLPGLCFATYEMTYAIIASAIISGSLVERVRFSAYVVFLALWSILIYAPLAHWVWGPGGWIRKMGALDFAGGTVIHISSGVSGFVAGAIIGPRRRAAEEGPASVPFVILGGCLLWFGWVGFNGGSALSVTDGVAPRAVASTLIAAASSMLTWLVLERLLKGRSSSVGAMVGAVAGLVCITPGAGYVTPSWSIILGLLAAPWCYLAVAAVNRLKLVDDTLDAFGLHGMGGMGGAILTGIFANDAGLIYSGSFQLLGKQIVSAFSAIAFSAIGTSVIVLLMKLWVNMRVAEDTESAVDERMHGETYHRPARAYNPKEDLCMHSPVKAYQRPDIAVGSSESTSSAV
ncbi:amt [Symbiodinium pilosum]|uniref:Amt protein n=1 Tax=Symbiodinium pilosum TaxID=2952 RepID=A0A812JM62_SYMPI|nr:amt [Symbiodinium pilosum]